MATPPNQLNASDYAPATWAAYLVAYNAWLQGLTHTPPPDPPKQSAAGAAAGAITNAAGAVAGPLHSVAGLIGELTNPKLWLRVAEVALGLVLIAVGIAKLTGVDNKIATLAGAAGKAAVVA